MESLGGDRRWADRFFAQHAAIIYYWVLIALWLLSPATAYTFSELIEARAVDTYGEFVDANAAALAALEAPAIARAYYGSDLQALPFEAPFLTEAAAYLGGARGLARRVLLRTQALAPPA
ncbi:alternative oxidase [Aureococcus anophagefferens]|uniref:Alternative oxidase n=1 Tax=Aureococcus anophagefferens TaxID=44056 RepID=A0ABR1G3M1_AURAN